MEAPLKISNLNDFIFCPRSIYFHNLYTGIDEKVFSGFNQSAGKIAHKNIDTKKYSSRKTIIQGVDIFSEELGIVGKIDLFDTKSGELIERKNMITKIYEGYLMQIWAQYFCLVEMGYNVRKLSFYSLKNNKKISVPIPTDSDKRRLKEVIKDINDFKLDAAFSQNLNKCIKCPYNRLCDYYKNDK
jgi:CRISPR-associated exonuclease Cas4